MTHLGLLVPAVTAAAAGMAGWLAWAEPLAAAQPTPALKARPSLISEADELSPGKVTWLGVHFKIQKNWHIYWDGRNDSGFPVEASISAPPGYKVGQLKWPAPKRHIAEGEILDHIYEDSVTLAFPVDVPATAVGSAEFSAKLSWLVCHESCVAEEAEVRLTLPVSATGSAESTPGSPAAASHPLFAAARAKWPKPLPDTDTPGSPNLAWQGSKVFITVDGARELLFYPLGDCSEVDHLIKAGAARGNSLNLQLRAEKGVSPVLHGVLEVRRSAKPDGSDKSTTEWFEIRQTASSPRESTKNP
ncbi:MAG: protein-disulfide reductase DsbD domain-containing protein [Phycisphaerales bacterium]